MALQTPTLEAIVSGQPRGIPDVPGPKKLMKKNASATSLEKLKTLFTQGIDETFRFG